jgi:RNA polymerase sigma-70 factor (ECF subfamily)
MQFAMIADQVPFMGRKKHQRDVFWNLAQNQTRFLYNVAIKYVGNRYDAEDLVQETLYTAYHKFHQLRDSQKFKSWMFTILRNHFLKWQRKKVSVQADEFEDGIDYISQLESVSLRQDAASVYETKAEADTIQSILDKLPEKYKAVLILYYMEDSSYQEIAEMLGVPIGTVMSRLSRAKQMMKKTLLRSTINEPQEKKVVRLNIKR